MNFNRKLFLAALLFLACYVAAAPAKPGVARENLALGNPSNATAEAANENNFLFVTPEYALSYNSSKGGPNWVSWHLEASDLGKVDRQDDFHTETGLPGGYKLARPSDYNHTGYDRGHMCDSKDRTATLAANQATFSMANMLPQTPDLNRHLWERLEAYSRKLVQQGNELYIVAGGIGSIGKLKPVKPKSGKRKKPAVSITDVNIPERTWKIILVVKANEPIDKNARVIAVSMPNVSGVSEEPWQDYITTAAAIESKTGYHFFSALSPALQAQFRSQRDSGK